MSAQTRPGSHQSNRRFFLSDPFIQERLIHSGNSVFYETHRFVTAFTKPDSGPHPESDEPPPIPNFLVTILPSRYFLLTPWCRVLLEQLTGLHLVKKFPAFHGTRRFITALTSVRHLSLSWASPIQSIYPHPTSWRRVLILSTHLCLGLPSGLLLLT